MSPPYRILPQISDGPVIVAEPEAGEDQPVSEETSVPEAEESTPPEESDTETQGQPPSSARSISARGGVGIDYLAWDMGNGDGFAHDGYELRVEGGAEFPVYGDFFLQLNGGAVYGEARQDLGAGQISRRSHWGLFLNGRAGIDFARDIFRATIGFDFGFHNVSSDGIRLDRNEALIPIDSTAPYASVEACISTLRGSISLCGGYGGELGLNPTIELVDSEVNPVSFASSPAGPRIGLRLDVVSFLYFLGVVNDGSHSSSSSEETEAGEAGEAGEGAEGSEAAEGSRESGSTAQTEGSESSRTLRGLPLVIDLQQRLEQHGQAVTQTREAVQAARREYRNISGRTEESVLARRVQAEEALAQGRAALTAYAQMVDEIGDARRAALRLRGADAQDANTRIQQMATQLTAAHQQASQTFTAAQTVVTAFNRLGNHGADIPFDLQGPTAPTGGTREQTVRLTPEQRAQRQAQREERARQRAERERIRREREAQQAQEQAQPEGEQQADPPPEGGGGESGPCPAGQMRNAQGVCVTDE